MIHIREIRESGISIEDARELIKRIEEEKMAKI
jgi:hypothetical protein